jgi:transmembrane 9 superfamily protein 2/4
MTRARTLARCLLAIGWKLLLTTYVRLGVNWWLRAVVQITALDDVDCQAVCKVDLQAGAKELRKLKARIVQEYRVHWYGNGISLLLSQFRRLLDMLPAATKSRITDSKGGQRVIYERGTVVMFVAVPVRADLQPAAGFPLGSVDGDEVFINNHLSVVVLYHELEANDGSINIVGVLVVPSRCAPLSCCPASNAPGFCSIRQDHTKGPDHWEEACTRRAHPQALDVTQETSIVYTYSVRWEKSPVEWSSRWDLYMGMGDSQSIHWFSILNSSMIVLFLTGMVALIMIRTLRSDLKRYDVVFLLH